MAATPLSEGRRDCGCAWRVFTRAIEFAQRCVEHQVMCRPLEQWEIELLPAWARPAAEFENRNRPDGGQP